ncbi:hypothetical protein [Amycolatopsis sp. SB7-3]|uniref:hypothetical protein n=1 Tax=Amycolatopsis sp. SB7-3 TaxID=3373438 RepID=UPI0037437578
MPSANEPSKQVRLSPPDEVAAWASDTQEGRAFTADLPKIIRELRHTPNSLKYAYDERGSALIAAYDAGSVEQALLTASHEDLLDGRQAPLVVAWLAEQSKYFDERVWRDLRIAVGVAAGVLAGRQAVREIIGESQLHRWRQYEEGHTEDLSRVRLAQVAPKSHCDLWANLTMLVELRRLRHRGQPALHDTAVRSRLEQHLHEHPEAWTEAMPWLLASSKNSHGYLESLLVATVAMGDSRFRKAVESAANHPHLAIRMPADGVLARADGTAEVELSEHLLEIVAGVLDDDRRRIQKFPQPLAEPTRTWLSYGPLERLMEDRAALGLDSFSEIIRMQGAAEEDVLTTRLLSCLEKEFSRIDTHLEITASHTARRPEISLAQRPVRKSDERTIGADIGLVVSIELPQKLRVNFGELIQVKKSKQLHGVTGASESWRIDIKQLNDILEHSPTSAYWLIQRSGSVLCLPAKLLYAITVAKTDVRSATDAAKSITVRYTEIRHAAIGLGQYLRDLLIGMWVGSRSELTLSTASGANDRIRPMHILDVAVRIQEGVNE